MLLLLKVSTKSKQKDIDIILENCTGLEIENIMNLYSTFEAVEYLNDSNYVEMMCIIDSYKVKNLIDIYEYHKIKFQITDISSKALYSDEIETRYRCSITGKSQSKKLKDLITKFYDSEISTDLILDKINERGLQSLTKKDKFILESL